MLNVTEQLSDEALLQGYVARGDRDALDALFRRYTNAAYATAMRVCRNKADAEDAVQSAFIQAMNSASSYRGDTEHGVRAWLMKIVVNCCKMAIRGAVRRRHREDIAGIEQDEAVLPEDPDAPATELGSRTAEVLEELDRLPEHYRSAIWLHHYEGMSRQAAAEALGWTEKSLSNQVFYGMQKLRKRLAERGVTTNMAGLAAVIPLLTLEQASADLVARIAAIAAGQLPSAGGKGAGAAGGISRIWWAAALVATVATGGVLAAVWLSHGKKSAVPATAQSASIRYVDGPKILFDQPQRDLSNWDILIRRADGAFAEASAEEKLWVRTVVTNRDGKRTSFLVVETPRNLKQVAIGLRLRQSIGAQSYAVELDGNGPMSLVTPGVETYKSLYSTPATEIKIGAGLWYRRRDEITPAPPDRPAAERELKSFVNKTLIYRGLLVYKHTTVLIECNGPRTQLDNVVIRELVPESAADLGKRP